VRRFDDIRLEFLARTARVLDVGANEGQWARRVRAVGYPGELHSFEPGATAYAKLERAAAGDPTWHTMRAAVGDRSGVMTLNVSANSYSSSLLPITGIHTSAAPDAAYVSIESVEATTLDALDLPPMPTYLKIDVQGYEPQVLGGAGRLLEHVIAVEAELSLVALYEGQLLAPEVCQLLRGHGFVPVAFQTAFDHPETGEILALDGLFARSRPGDGLVSS
jgi:FkbM family methyltransferase